MLLAVWSLPTMATVVGLATSASPFLPGISDIVTGKAN